MNDTNSQRAVELLVTGISVSLDCGEDEVFRIAASRMKRAGINPARLRFRVYRKSVDARKKKDIRLVFSVAARSDEKIKVSEERLKSCGISTISEGDVSPEFGSERMQGRPLVVGMGPAGLFAALLLAENGYFPILIDRGDSVEKRCEINRHFIELGELDCESNIQFGAGGAGTFSDGKLMTRINDPKLSYVLSRFCDFGAPEEIMSAAKPHIGTDILVRVVDDMLRYIESCGGDVIYRCRMDGIKEMGDGTLAVLTTKGEIKCSLVILAPGHSARDTYKMLLDDGYMIAPKDFSVGVRVEHHRESIDKALYGDFASHPALGAAEYHLSDTTGDRGVYTFCMCPGGQVVAGASEQGGVVVNGMSNYARDGGNSNSAVAVSVFKSDYGATPMAAIEFQRRIERLAYEAGGSDFCAPVQTLGAFVRGETGRDPWDVMPTYRDGKVKTARLDDLFPSYISETLRRGLLSFDRKISGFASDGALLTGAETRTSAPVRILRGEDMCAVGHSQVYPCGEGAGYAGGISSSAVDGIRAALAVIKRYAPDN